MIASAAGAGAAGAVTAAGAATANGARGAGSGAPWTGLQAVATAIAIAITGCQRGEGPPPPHPPGPTPALWFGGDVHLGVAPRGGLSGMEGLLDGAEGVVNLEGPVGAGPGFAEVTPAGVRLANPAGSGAFLRANGVRLVSLANNHAGDDAAGVDGSAATVAALEGDVVPFGGAAGRGALTVGGVDVVLFAHDLGEPDVPGAVGRELAAERGLTVESFHVTGPPSYLPRAELDAAVEAAVLGGADIVVAHGTHVVGPVERRGGAVIAWGLGNLLFDCTCTEADEAIVLRVELGEGLRAEVIPVRAGLHGAAAGLSPDPTGVLDLVAALGGSPFERTGGVGRF